MVTAPAEPEAGRDPEQLRQPAGLGGRARGEPGGAPQEPRRPCEFCTLREGGGCGGRVEGGPGQAGIQLAEAALVWAGRREELLGQRETEVRVLWQRRPVRDPQPCFTKGIRAQRHLRFNEWVVALV